MQFLLKKYNRVQVQVKLPLINVQGVDLGLGEASVEGLCRAEDMLLKAWRPALTDEEAVQKEVYAASCSTGPLQVPQEH